MKKKILELENNLIASISDLKRNPLGLLKEARHFPITILSRNKPAMIVMSIEFYEQLLEELDDAELAIKLIQEGRIDPKSG